MADLRDYLLGDYRDTVTYMNKMGRYGVTKFSPLIISCAITGGVHGKEANPNLPETPEEQVQATYDAYNAGASLVHIHRRASDNLSVTTSRPEEFLEVNRMIREKCPDIIINNTCVGGRVVLPNNTLSPQMLPSPPARPEVASLDIVAVSTRMKMGARKAPLTPEREEAIFNFDLFTSQDDAVNAIKEFNKYDVKPEFELFDLGNIKYIYNLIETGLVKGPYWVQMLFGGNGIFPTADNMLAASRLLPPDSLFSVIGIGACQTAMATLAIILGHHVRVGLEDNVFYGPRQLATSNAQLVERIVRIAKELGRPIATPAQAREMMGLGAPRQYDFTL